MKPIIGSGGKLRGYLRENPAPMSDIAAGSGDRVELLSPGGRLLGIYLSGPDQTIRPGGGGLVGYGNLLLSLLED